MSKHFITGGGAQGGKRFAMLMHLVLRAVDRGCRTPEKIAEHLAAHQVQVGVVEACLQQLQQYGCVVNIGEAWAGCTLTASFLRAAPPARMMNDEQRIIGQHAENFAGVMLMQLANEIDGVEELSGEDQARLRSILEANLIGFTLTMFPSLDAGFFDSLPENLTGKKA